MADAAQPAAPGGEAQAQRLVGSWALGAHIGAGSFAIVWRARHVEVRAAQQACASCPARACCLACSAAGGSAAAAHSRRPSASNPPHPHSLHSPTDGRGGGGQGDQPVPPERQAAAEPGERGGHTAAHPAPQHCPPARGGGGARERGARAALGEHKHGRDMCVQPLPPRRACAGHALQHWPFITLTGGRPPVSNNGVLRGRRPGPPAAPRQAPARGGRAAPDAPAGRGPAPDVEPPPGARERRCRLGTRGAARRAVQGCGASLGTRRAGSMLPLAVQC